MTARNLAPTLLRFTFFTLFFMTVVQRPPAVAISTLETDLVQTTNNLVAQTQNDDEEPPFDPPPPREYVILELDVVTPTDMNIGLGGQANIVVKVHNTGNIKANNVTVRIDGTDAYQAVSEVIDEIRPGNHKNVNLKIDFLGRFTYDHPLYVIAQADNGPPATTEIITLTFGALNAQKYFADDSYVQLLADRLPKDKRALGERPWLLQFEILDGYPIGESLTIDLSSLLNDPTNNLTLTMLYKPSEGAGDILPVTWDAQEKVAQFIPPAAGEYTLTYTWSEQANISLSSAGPTSEEEVPVVSEPQINLSQVGEFTGSVSYAYPLTIPPGENGIEPPLILTYSSGAFNGGMGDVQSNPYGAGWSLTAHVDIVQTLSTCHPDNSGGHTCEKAVDDGNGNTYNQYRLNLFGSNYELFHANGKNNNGNPGRYYAVGDASLYVSYCKGSSVEQVCQDADNDDGTSNGIPDSGGQRSGGFWVVKTAANKTYRLGYTNESEQEVRSGYEIGSDLDNLAYRWRVDKISDRFANTVTYAYVEEEITDSLGGWGVQTTTSRLTEINYGSNKIEFDYSYLGHYSIAGWSRRIISIEHYILSGIAVRVDSIPQPVRTYSLTYNWERYGDYDGSDNLPVSVNQSTTCHSYKFGAEDGDYSPNTASLLQGIQETDRAGSSRRTEKDVTFSYYFYRTAKIHLGHRNGTTSRIYCAPFMVSMNTFYGPMSTPTVEYTFDENQSDYYVTPDNQQNPSPGDWFRYNNSVQSQTIYSGWVNDAPNMHTHFKFAQPDYQGPEDTFQGFKEVFRCEGGNSCENDGGWLRKTKSSYLAEKYTDNNSTFTGKLNKTESYHANGVLVASMQNWWKILDTAATASTRHPIVYRTEVTDNRGGMAVNRTEFSYDAYGNQTQVRELGGRAFNSTPWRTLETMYVYNTNLNDDKWLINLPWRVTLWNGNADGGNGDIVWRTRYRYDNLAASTTPTDGLLTHKERLICTQWATNPPNQNCLAWAWQAPTVYRYGGSGGGSGQTWQVTGVTDPDGRFQNLTWLNATQLQQRQDAVGTTIYWYGDSNTPWLLTQVQTPNGAKTAYTYDSFGRLLTQKAPDPNSSAVSAVVKEFSYGDASNPFYIAEKTPNPNDGSAKIITRTYYDALGRPLQKRSWGMWGTDGKGDDNSTDGSIIDIQYDTLGRATCETIGLHTAQSNYYDFNSSLNCTWYGYGKTVTAYDVLNDVTAVTAPNGAQTTTVINGRSRTVTDGAGKQTTTTQDELGRLVSVKDALNNTTSYSYDLADNLTSVNGPDGVLTTMAYNLLGQKVYMHDPDMGIWSYAYDAGGSLTRQTDAKNQRICFSYDAAGRLDALHHRGSGAGACPTSGGSLLADYAYHSSGAGKGALSSITYPGHAGNDVDSFSYDYRQRITAETRTLNGRTYTRSASYDNLDRVRTVSVNGETITTAYDGLYADSLTSSAAGIGAIVSNMPYNNYQQLAGIERPGGRPDSSFTYYDKSNNYRLNTIQHGVDNALPDFTYANYDPVGNIKELRTNFDTWTETQTFGYDNLYRLNTAVAAGGIANHSYNYTYDAGGNLTARSGTGGARAYSYNHSAHKHAVSSVSGGLTASFSYDANGNMTNRTVSGVSYGQTWDVQNRLTAVTVGAQTTQFYYDANGQRTLTIQPDGTYIYTPFPDYEETILPTAGNIRLDRPMKEAAPSTNNKKRVAVSTNSTLSSAPVHRYALDEGGGSSAGDSAGSADGVLHGPTWDSGQLNGALRFDGVDDYVDLGDIDLGSSALTIAFWFKADDFGVHDARFVSKAVGVNEQDHDWMVSTLNGSQLRFRLKTNGSTATLVTGSGAITTGQWYHIAAVYDGSQMRLYKNGVQAASQSKSGGISNGNASVALGNQPTGAGARAFDGLLDEVCLYDQALSAAEIAGVMSAGCGGGNPPTATSSPAATSSPTATNIFSTVEVTSVATQTPAGATPTSTPTGGGSGQNILQNGDFEAGQTGWNCKNCAWSVVSPGYGGSGHAGQVVVSGGSSWELRQYNLALEPNTAYRLRFEGKADGSRNLSVQLLKHGSPYTNYGLSESVSLNTGWQTTSYEFTTSGFSSPVNDARLRLRIYATGVYHFDNVVLEKVDGSAATATAPAMPTTTATPPTGPTATPTATATNPPGGSGPVHRYSLDEGSGSTANDSAGSAHGVLHGPTWDSGQLNGALRFDGVDDYVDLGDIDLNGSSLTIAFWFKADDFGIHDARLISKAIGVNEQDHDWMVSTLNGSQLRFRLKTNGTTSTLVTGSGAITSGQWYHITAVYDGSHMRLYKNGVQAASQSKSGTITNGNASVALGNQPTGAGARAFDGLLDEVCLYDKALSPAEISGIMSTGCGGSGNPPTPTASPTPLPNATATASPTPPPANDIAKIQRTYYTLGGQMIGVRVKKIRSNGVTESDNLYYTYADHLGNVTALSDANGNYVSNSLALFRPFGSYRLEPTTNPDITDRGFTGHKENLDIGLTYMNARYYLGYLNRFISADPIVPNPRNPQSLNRYTYGLNNPLRFTDPSGSENVSLMATVCRLRLSILHFLTLRGMYLWPKNKWLTKQPVLSANGWPV